MNLTKVGVLKEIEKFALTQKNKPSYPTSVIDELRSIWKVVKTSTSDDQILKALNELKKYHLSADEFNRWNRIILGFEDKLNPYKDEYVVNSSGSELIYNIAFVKSQRYSHSKDIFDYKQFKETD